METLPYAVFCFLMCCALCADMSSYYKQCLKPNMAHYERTEENRFIYTQINQKEIDALNVMAYVGYWLLPEKLQIAVNGGMLRCFNYGHDYSHFYTAWFYMSSITAYLGHFTLQGYIDNGFRFLEGESKGFNRAYSFLRVSYSWKDWQFSLSWSNPFAGSYKSTKTNIGKPRELLSGEQTALAELSCSYRIRLDKPRNRKK